jgi:hypothetical protein
MGYRPDSYYALGLHFGSASVGEALKFVAENIPFAESGNLTCEITPDESFGGDRATVILKYRTNDCDRKSIQTHEAAVRVLRSRPLVGSPCYGGLYSKDFPDQDQLEFGLPCWTEVPVFTPEEIEERARQRDAIPRSNEVQRDVQLEVSERDVMEGLPKIHYALGLYFNKSTVEEALAFVSANFPLDRSCKVEAKTIGLNIAATVVIKYLAVNHEDPRSPKHRAAVRFLRSTPIENAPIWGDLHYMQYDDTPEVIYGLMAWQEMQVFTPEEIQERERLLDEYRMNLFARKERERWETDVSRVAALEEGQEDWQRAERTRADPSAASHAKF